MNDIILFGIPGAGKGTQADLLKNYMQDHYVHLSTGDVFRALLSKPNAIGNLVQARMNAGLLINDKVSMSLFDVYFYSVIEQDKYMLLDGYPRSIPQLNNFLSKAYDYERSLTGIYFDLPEDTASQRMLSRARDGETIDVIRTRMEKYYKTTAPIMQAFAAQQQLITIDASGSEEEVHQLVIAALTQVQGGFDQN